jgi:hypothetical protein
MEEICSMSATEMLARRDAAENEVASLIGNLVFSYSRLVTSLHLCVAWHNDGKELDRYKTKAEDLAAADLIKKIEAQSKSKHGDKSDCFKSYESWAIRANAIRELRNIIMHSRWSIEPYGRHAIAISTPILVEPIKELTFTANQLRLACSECDSLNRELNKLRKDCPL